MKGAASFSVEFFPPKDEAGESKLWESLSAISDYRPEFVSVTYGAGGSNQDRTVRVTSEITKRTGLRTVAHLTCVGASKEQLHQTLLSYRAADIGSVLALRGDPVGGPSAKWESVPGGFDHADQLVSLAIELGFEVGVAAFPDKHPASANLAQDVEVLLEKERRGARFATTQFFFDSSSYFNLVDSLRGAGSQLPVIAGILPITNVKQLERMALLGGTPIPESIRNRVLRVQDDPIEVRKVGIEIAVELGNELLAGGVPGLHFYTMNSATSTLSIINKLGLR